LTAEADRKFARWREVLTLWAGVLIAPLAWALQMQAGYILVQPACQAGRNTLLHIVTLAALLLAALGGFIAWRKWQQTGRAWPDEAAGALARSRFMAVLGLLLSVMFFLVIVAQGIASFVLHPCQP
jgi:hypothetical protein